MLRQTFIIVVGISFILMDARTSISQSDNCASALPPHVRKAVGPIFIPFAFGSAARATIDVEATIDPAGAVVSARIVDASTFRDRSAENALRKWSFEPCTGSSERTVVVRLVYTIVGPEAAFEDLTPIFTENPLQFEERQRIFPPQITEAPKSNPPKNASSQEGRKKKRGHL